MQCLDKLNISMGLKLSDLLKKSIELEKLDFASTTEVINKYIADVESNLADLTYVSTAEQKELAKEIKLLLEKYHNNALSISKNLKKIVYGDSDQYMTASEDIWRKNSEKMLFHEQLEWIKLWPPNKEEFDAFAAKVLNYSNWLHPGLIYGAKNTDLLEAVKSCEPMYIMEQHKEYFPLQKDKFHLDFIRKLKFYHLNDINLLPNNDIGLIVAFNEFPFLPWNTIQIILQKFIEKLMPGGILIFNYNNCATVRGFKMFEDGNMTYTTPHMYINFLCRQDLSVLENVISGKETFSYMIFQKNGNRKLIKKYPSVGYIKQQPSFKNHELHHKKRIELIRKLVNGK
jgi:hypothetical protein